MRHLLVLLAFFLATAVSAADLVLTNGRVYTVDPSNPWVEAVVIENGTLGFVGSNEGAEDFIKADSEVIDLEGSFVMPGIHDVHMHPLEAYDGAEATCVLTDGQSASTHARKIETCAKNNPSSSWITAWGYYIEDILNLRNDPKKILDQVVSERPIAAMELTSHAIWVNSKALELAGITAQTPNPPGGVIVKNSKGEPNGILLDNAGNMIREQITEPTPESLDLTYHGLLEGLDELARNGITSISDARVYWRKKHHEVWQRAEREGNLSVRANLALWTYPHIDDRQIETLQQLYDNNSDSLLRINQIKMYVDGITPLTTAALKKEYEFDYGWIDRNRGLNYFDQQRLTKFLSLLEPLGFDFLIHSIGDRATDEALNAIEQARLINGNLGQRHRLTHLELVDPIDIARFRELGVSADMQVAGDWTHPKAYHRDVGYLIGDRGHEAIPLRSFYDAGVNLTLSSDFDVSTMNPFVGMKNALTRGDQSLPSIKEVIEAYTINAAFSMRQEEWTGSLEVGKAADLVVLDRDITKINTSKIDRTKVLLTMLEGRETYRAKDF